MALIDVLLILVIGILLLVLAVLYLVRKKKENLSKKLARLFDEAKKPETTRSPHLILGVMVVFSKVLGKIFKGLFKTITHRVSSSTMSRIEAKLQLGAYPFMLNAHEWYWFKITTSLVFFMTMFAISAGNEQWGYLVYAVLLAVLGFYYPDYFLNTLLQKRNSRISRELPDAMDFLSLCLAAGMNFQLAVEEYIKRNATLLADEFSIFINQIDVGVQRVEAFQHLLERNESPEMKNFLSSVIQSERLGTSLRPVIASQAEDLREKRKQFVEKMIAQAPVKMLFPMMFFILPAMLVVTLSSVLLPSKPEIPGYVLTEQNFLYVPVTPGIQVRINGKPYPVYKIEKIEMEGQIQFVSGHPQAIISEEQSHYVANYFSKNTTMEEAFFVRIDLPYDQRVRLSKEFRSKEGKVERKLMTLKTIKFDLHDFIGARLRTTSSRMLFKGRLTPGNRLEFSLNREPIRVRFDEEDPEAFLTPMANLRNGRNVLQARISDHFGGEMVKDYTIIYQGISVSAKFREREETLKDVTILQGEGNPGAVLHVMRVKGGKSHPELEILLENEGFFSIPIPLEIGQNMFRIFIRKDNEQSPVVQCIITRKMTE